MVQGKRPFYRLSVGYLRLILHYVEINVQTFMYLMMNKKFQNKEYCKLKLIFFLMKLKMMQITQR